MTTKERATELFKLFIEREIGRSRRAADAYHSTAARTGLGYDHIYQVFKGKPAGKVVSLEAVSRLAQSYREDGEFADLVAMAPSVFVEATRQPLSSTSPSSASAGNDDSLSLVEPPTTSAVARSLIPSSPGARYLVAHLGALLQPRDKTDRKQAAAILENLALNPDEADLMAEKLAKLLGESQQLPAFDSQQVNQK